MSNSIVEISAITDDILHQLSLLLIDVVHDGASIGFLPPVNYEDAKKYWQGVIQPDNKLLIARIDGTISGSVQINLCSKQNGNHRAEIAKLMVHTKTRRMGIGRRLMEAAELKAKNEQRNLLVLDTRDGDPSNILYQSLGFVEAGKIPFYAQSANGKLDTTVFYYKKL